MEKIFAWENIIGNADNIAQLKRFISDKNFPHAIIFSGVEGIGKRKIAETCAAALICDHPTDGEPCGVCDSCKLFAARSHPDFVVVEPEDTKTTRTIKIAQIRDLHRTVALKPNIANRRVVVIDGAEFMNKPAANCILKTLEEPPGQTIFILVTANRAGLLMTIRSRCTTMNFDKLPAAQIESYLITHGIDELKAQKLSFVADGSLGRALILEQSGGYEIRDAALTTINQLCRKELTDEIIFAKGKMFETYSRNNFLEFVNHMQKILRDIFISASGGMEIYNADLREKLSAIKISEDTLHKMLAEGTQAQRRLKTNANLRLLAEAYLMRLRSDVG